MKYFSMIENCMEEAGSYHKKTFRKYSENLINIWKNSVMCPNQNIELRTPHGYQMRVLQER